LGPDWYEGRFEPINSGLSTVMDLIGPVKKHLGHE
jgi:hypothetical protein